MQIMAKKAVGTTRKRGESVRVLGLPVTLQVKFRRAVQLTGQGSQAQYLHSVIRKLIREAEAAHGNLLTVLTPDEDEVVRVINDGAAEFGQIVEETLIAAGKVEKLLTELIDRGILEVRKKGGKTEQARGASIKMYFLASDYHYKPKLN